MTLLVILGIIALAIGCVLIDSPLDYHDEKAPRRRFKRW
jgi:hypothetical protein